MFDMILRLIEALVGVVALGHVILLIKLVLTLG